MDDGGGPIWYNQLMSTPVLPSMIEHLLRPIEQSMPPEAARWLIGIRADDELQERYDELADKNTEGTITPEELSELEQYVLASEFIGLMQAKARRVLSHTNGNA
jgi:hypothetical protein